MNNPPAFQFYASDYLSSSKVQRMSLEAEGAYIRLLAYSWQDGFIPADIGQLSRMCKVTPKRMSALWEDHLRDCFEPRQDDATKLINRRLEEVRATQLAFKAERSEAGSRGAAQRWKGHGSANGSAIKEPIAKNGSPSPSPSSEIPPIVPPPGDEVLPKYTPEFERFWKEYPRKVAKEEAFKAWKKRKFSQQTQELIMQAVDTAKRSWDWTKERGQYIPHASTWLNGGRWDDDLKSSAAPSNGSHSGVWS